MKKNPIKEKAFEKIREWYYSYDPEPVYYIQRYDNEDEYDEEIDGDYCERCAEIKAKELDEECNGEYHHEVCEESMPENCYFSHCSECGCLLNADLIVSEFADEELKDVVYDLKGIKTFDEIKGELAWKLHQFLFNEKESKALFPKEMKYISQRITDLYKKTIENENN